MNRQFHYWMLAVFISIVSILNGVGDAGCGCKNCCRRFRRPIPIPIPPIIFPNPLIPPPIYPQQPNVMVIQQPQENVTIRIPVPSPPVIIPVPNPIPGNYINLNSLN